MSKYINDKEMLSAFIDGELSTEEINYITEKLTTSKELQIEFEKLKKSSYLIKKSISTLPENDYLETRVIAEIETPSKKHKLKKWVPVLVFCSLAVVFMFLFKADPKLFSRFFEMQKANIASIYTQNLKPLLFAASLKNEDVFNFAMYKQLPLDENKDQYIVLGYNDNGKEYFEIKSGSSGGKALDLKTFVRLLNLNDEQKRKVDSILSTYSEKIQSQVLINDKNSIALNTNLWNFNKAISADLINYAYNINSKVVTQLIPTASNINNPETIKTINQIKNNNDNNFIFFTPDSIFTFKVDKKKIDKEIAKMKEEMKMNNLALKQMSKEIRINVNNSIKSLRTDKTWSNGYTVYFDSNTCKVEVPEVVIPDFDLPGLDSLPDIIDKALGSIEDMHVDIDKNKLQFKVKINGKEFNQNMKIPDIDSLMKGDKKNMRNFKINSDSLRIIIKQFQDSLNINMPQLKEQLNQMKKELKKFQEKMENENKKNKKRNQELEI